MEEHLLELWKWVLEALLKQLEQIAKTAASVSEHFEGSFEAFDTIWSGFCCGGVGISLARRRT